MSHTKGPWEWRGKPGESELHGARGCVLGYAHYEGMWLSYDAPAKGRAANARLIAAAPDLLEALEQSFDFPADFFDRPEDENEMIGITITGRHLRMVRAAIAKAKGES